MSLGCGMLGTFKDTSSETALLYKQFAPERMRAYEQEMTEAACENNVAPG